jgi:hypothetical protein
MTQTLPAHINKIKIKKNLKKSPLSSVLKILTSESACFIFRRKESSTERPLQDCPFYIEPKHKNRQSSLHFWSSFLKASVSHKTFAKQICYIFL